MITLYSGTPGSGKSFHLITVIFRSLRQGKYVISNYPVSFSKKELKRGYAERFFYWQNEQITVDNLIEFALEKGFIEDQKESRCLVVIDEAGGRFNCRDYAKSDRTAWIDFFSQHRKAGYDFILVAQMDRMIDRQIRGYIETEKKHRKLNNFGPFFFLPFPVFVAIEHWYTAKVKVGSEFILFRKSIASKYNSMQFFSGFKISQELLARIEAKRSGKEHELDPAFTVSINAIYTEDAATN